MVKTTLTRVYISDKNKLNRLAKRKKTTVASIIRGLLKSVR